MRRLALVSGLALLVLAAGCSSPSSLSPSGFLSGMAGHDQIRVVQTAVAVLMPPSRVQTTEESGRGTSSSDLTLLENRSEISGRFPDLSVYIVGSARNTGRRTIDTGLITVTWFDRAGTILGTSRETVGSLDPGETVKFNISYDGDASEIELDHYEIAAADLYK